MASWSVSPHGSMRSSRMPWEPGVALTPLPEAGKVDYLNRLLDDAVARARG